MDPFQRIIGVGVLAIVIYGITKFYWLRVLACAVLLALWGLIAVIAPIYLAHDDLSNGRVFESVFTLAISIVIALPWYLGFQAARTWIADEIRYGRWTNMPWNAR